MPVRLYIMRHGAALDAGTPGVKGDAARPLSEDGREKTEDVARGLASIDAVPARVASSPLCRAAETAEIVARACGLRGRVERCDFLAPGAWSPEALWSWLRAQDAEPCLVVGHMPDVADMAASCLFGEVRPGLEFRKAAVAAIVFEGRVAAGGGRLEWLLPPRILRRLGRGTA